MRAACTLDEAEKPRKLLPPSLPFACVFSFHGFAPIKLTLHPVGVQTHEHPRARLCTNACFVASAGTQRTFTDRVVAPAASSISQAAAVEGSARRPAAAGDPAARGQSRSFRGCTTVYALARVPSTHKSIRDRDRLRSVLVVIWGDVFVSFVRCGAETASLSIHTVVSMAPNLQYVQRAASQRLQVWLQSYRCDAESSSRCIAGEFSFP